MSSLAWEIKNAALEMGYQKCGIIKIADMAGYEQKLSERIEAFPEVRPAMEGFFRFAHLEDEFPWAKSIVVCVRHYGRYIIPKNLKGLIGKYYLFDGRLDEQTDQYQDSVRFEDYLKELGLKVATERKFGITALRWAAQQAGLGVVRKNNFLYTELGSWVNLAAWLIDRELELKAIPTLKECPEKCDLCIMACPTGSLSQPYAMNRSTCISCITTWEGWDLMRDEHRAELGRWIYGCDVCQDVCPLNHGRWQETVEYPGLSELSSLISLEKILEMDEKTLEQVLKPKFWYIKRSDNWKWKTKAINAMVNCYDDRYRQPILDACNDSHPKVREMAEWASHKLNLV